ncbi:MAG: 1,4-dihydroxy-6-naphthoate synthase [Bacteroidota bacterium]|nr:1,4-dihydroxy-6-naphthoate synthase [Bacteroidota bacterium]
MTYTLGFSPCPNDTFIFDALVNKKIDTEGLSFEPVLEDVETLNQWALQGKLDITKLSFPAFFQSLDKYILLNAGSALGKGVGPLLISKSEVGSQKSEVEHLSIALPGTNTTANLLFSFAFPSAKRKIFIRYNEIEDFILKDFSKVSPSGGDAEGADLGVIIHENRFTYQQKGLHKVLDLGEYWEEKMKVPIPLGGIAARRSLDPSLSLKIDRLIRKSLEYAFANYPAIPAYVKQHSQTMSEDVMRQHIDLYVNDYSLDLGNDGRKAIEILQQVFASSNEKDSLPAADLFL